MYDVYIWLKLNISSTFPHRELIQYNTFEYHYVLTYLFIIVSVCALPNFKSEHMIRCLRVHKHG